MKKLFLMLAASIVVVSLSGCGKEEAKTDETLTPTASEEALSDAQDDMSESAISKNECMNGCKMMWAANKGNAGKSLDDMGMDCNNLCDAQQGMQNNDLDACEKSEGILKYSCYTEIARKTKNQAICGSIDDATFKDTCYMGLAEEMKDNSMCNKISSAMFKGACLQNLKQ